MALKPIFHVLQLFTLFKQKKVPQKLRNFQEPTMRFELTTSSLPRKRSTPELRRQNLNKKITAAWCDFLERKTGVEPATFSLEGWRSTNWATSAFLFVGKRFANLLNFLKSSFIKCGESRIRTYEAEATELQSVPFDRSGISPILQNEPPEGFEPTTPRLQITCSGQLS